MGRLQIFVIFCAWVVSVVAQPALPAPPIQNPAGGGGSPAVPNLGIGGKPSINNLPQLNPLNPASDGRAKLPISELGADSTENVESVKGEEVLEVEFDFAAGRGLRLFGLDFFLRPPGGAGLDVVPVYEDYRVGPGDEVLIVLACRRRREHMKWKNHVSRLPDLLRLPVERLIEPTSLLIAPLIFRVNLFTYLLICD